MRATIVLTAAALAAVQGQTPTLEQVLARAGDYVLEFQRQLSGVVAEETYTQDVRPMVGSIASSRMATRQHRVLKSDVLLVRPQGGGSWVQFRDVFEVDNRPVRDRDERLVELFLKPTGSTRSHVERITSESARYNIGNVARNINVPVFALTVLVPANQPSFKFTRLAAGNPALVDAPRVDGAWVIEYREIGVETIIRTNNGRNLPTHGRFWIDPDSGRVWLSELVANDYGLTATIDVTYREEPPIGAFAPVEMRERYELRPNGPRVGVATYGRFRQFQVKVDETLGPIKK